MAAREYEGVEHSEKNSVHFFFNQRLIRLHYLSSQILIKINTKLLK